VRRGFLLAVLLPFVAACSDSEEAPEATTQEEYDAEAERLCNQHGDIIERAFVEQVEDSDAEEAAFYTTDLIPRTRALIRRLADTGFPPERDAEYREALTEAMAVLAEIEADPFAYIDQRHRRETPPEEDLLNRLRASLDAADVPC
jgi:hypothetical protein